MYISNGVISQDIFHTAKHYYDAGLNIMPLRSKHSPVLRWKEHKQQRFGWFLLQHYFPLNDTGNGIAIITGYANLEVLDFDSKGKVFRPFINKVKSERAYLLNNMPIVKTAGGGFHLYYQCEAVEGNKKLALDENGEVLIETRGQGGYVVAPGSPLTIHPSGNPYILLRGDLTAIPEITAEERSYLFDVARSFNHHTNLNSPGFAGRKEGNATLHSPAIPLRGRENASLRQDSGRWGDWFNQHGDWEEILLPLGWTIEHQYGETTYWKRPGKLDDGHSASTNHNGLDLFYLFSTSIPELDAGRGYNKFFILTALVYRGDYTKSLTYINSLIQRKENNNE